MGFRGPSRRSAGTLDRKVWVLRLGWRWAGGVRRIGKAYGTEVEPFVGYLRAGCEFTRSRREIEGKRTFGVPSAQDDTTISRVLLDLLDTLSKLVNSLTRIVLLAIHVFCSKVPPLKAIHGPQVALASMSQPTAFQERFRAIPIPYLDTLFGKDRRVCGTMNEPQEFLNDPAHECSFCG